MEIIVGVGTGDMLILRWGENRVVCGNQIPEESVFGPEVWNPPPCEHFQSLLLLQQAGTISTNPRLGISNSGDV